MITQFIYFFPQLQEPRFFSIHGFPSFMKIVSIRPAKNLIASSGGRVAHGRPPTKARPGIFTSREPPKRPAKVQATSALRATSSSVSFWQLSCSSPAVSTLRRPKGPNMGGLGSPTVLSKGAYFTTTWRTPLVGNWIFICMFGPSPMTSRTVPMPPDFMDFIAFAKVSVTVAASWAGLTRRACQDGDALLGPPSSGSGAWRPCDGSLP